MTGLEGIPVRVEDQTAAGGLTDNVLPVLHEIRHALDRLVEDGEPTIVDLTAMPFGPGDEERLLAALGSGEVAATIDTIGLTQVRETSFPGVWLVDHLSAEGARLVLHVEVATVPSLLATPAEDLAEARRRLDVRLADFGAGDDQPTQ
jgi:hydrogenase-1 operon protein HyaF